MTTVATKQQFLVTAMNREASRVGTTYDVLAVPTMLGSMLAYRVFDEYGDYVGFVQKQTPDTYTSSDELLNLMKESELKLQVVGHDEILMGANNDKLYTAEILEVVENTTLNNPFIKLS